MLDLPALAQADVGIAFGSGTEVARRAADITLISDDLSRLADLSTLARRTAGIIRQNLFWACLYNAVCIPLAVVGVIKIPSSPPQPSACANGVNKHYGRSASALRARRIHRHD